MKSILKYFKDKINDKNYEGYLTKLIYQFCTNPECKPTSLDKLEIRGYCKIIRTTHGLLDENYSVRFGQDVAEHNILIVYNSANHSYTYWALPSLDINNDLGRHVFSSGDLCFYKAKRGFLEGTAIISNKAGDELLIETYQFENNMSIRGEDFFPEHFIPFSEFCLEYSDSDEVPSLKEIVEEYNE